MRNKICFLAAACLGIFAWLLAGGARGEQPVAMKIEAPELTGIQEWINSRPLTLKELRGQVVVLHFWTFG